MSRPNVFSGFSFSSSFISVGSEEAVDSSTFGADEVSTAFGSSGNFGCSTGFGYSTCGGGGARILFNP